MRIFKRVFSIILICITLQSVVFSQNRQLDSLKNLLKETKDDTTKIKTLNILSKGLINVSDYSQAMQYITDAIALTNPLLPKLGYEKFAKKALAQSYNNMGIIHEVWGEYDKALELYLKSLKIREEIADKNGMAASYNNIGNIYLFKGASSKALEYYFKAVKMNQESGNKKWLANNYNNIGGIYTGELDFRKSLEFYFKALNIRKDINDKEGIASSYNNIGRICATQGNHKQALDFLFKGLKILEGCGDKEGIARSYTNIGDTYLAMGNIKEAKASLLKGLSIDKEINAKPDMVYSYKFLSTVDSISGDFRGAYEYHKLYAAIKDSIFNETSNRQLTEMQAKYDAEKKDNEIKLLNKDKDTQGQRQKFTLIALALVVILTGVLGFAFYNKKNANKIITAQKQLVDEKNKEITDSITYAKRIQTAILPPHSHIKKYFPESFVLFKPKDIVAGDFYWMEVFSDRIFIAAADCTGHGVPGAMVSVVCSNALNRAVNEFRITEPGLILDKTTELILETFERSESDVKDGMDISLCSIPFGSGNIQWAGANNPLRYFQDGELKELVPDKQPIGKHENKKPFTTHNLKLNKSDTLYLFSDGYTDQFGGKEGKKFMTKRFKDTLLSIKHLDMAEQKMVLERTFEEWKGNHEQVDDVLLIGVRV